MNAFEKHKITHLSASSLNKWRANQAAWFVTYLGGYKDDYTPSAWRGKAVEDGLTAALRGHDPTGIAFQTFEANAMGEASDEVDAERKLVAPMLAQAIKWSPPSPLLLAQAKVELWLDGVPIPVIGYADYIFEDGLIVDLKTTKACPSSPRSDHVRQVAIYRAARNNAPGSVLYVTHAKHALYPVGDNTVAEALNELRADALSLERFLSVVDSAQDALHMLPLNSDDFRVSEGLKIAHQNLMHGVYYAASDNHG